MRLPSSPIREESFTSRLRSATVAARVGIWLGVCFGIAFVTGLLSHYAQLDHHPIPYPTSPSWGYRLTQSMHVIFGVASIPLLLVKLWSVQPKLFQAMPKRLGPLVLVGLERISILVLVAASLIEVTIGVMNVAHWYLWAFDFRKTHYALGFLVIGALLVHIAVKLPITREVLGADIEHTGRDRAAAVVPGALSRRGLVRTAWLSAAVAAVVGSSATGTLPLVNRLGVLSVRSREPDAPPINVSAKEAGVVAKASSSSYNCTVRYAGQELILPRSELLSMPQTTHDLPIACVEGWSQGATWTGVRVRDLLDRLGAPRGSDVRVTSLQQGTPESSTVLPGNFVDDERTLLALSMNGRPLALDHGFPARIIAPDRPGALQTKWVTALEVV